MFDTKYPIVCAPMFKVSNINLAIAARNAGCLPSFTNGYLSDAQQYSEQFDDNFIFFLSINFDQTKIMKMKEILHLKAKYISYSLPTGVSAAEYFKNIWNRKFIEDCKKQNCILILKTKVAVEDSEYFDVVNIHGNESAGGIIDKSTKELFLDQIKLTPNKIVLPAGGIANSSDINWYLNNGTNTVMIGTLFAASLESPIAENAKQLFVTSTKADIKSFTHRKTNVLILKEFVGKDDKNNSNSLALGVSGKGGHLYAGHGVDQIKEILPFNEIVRQLMLGVTIS